MSRDLVPGAPAEQGRAPRLLLAGSPDELACPYRFYRKYGWEVSALLTETAEQARLLAGGCAVPVLPFATWAARPEGAGEARLVLASSDLAFRARVSDWFATRGQSDPLPIFHACLYSSAIEELIDALSYNDPRRPSPYVQALLAGYPESGEDPIRCLAGALSERMRSEIEPGRPTLGVLYELAEYRNNLGSAAMYDRLREAGCNVVFLFGTLCQDGFERRPWSYYVGQGVAKHLDWLDALFVYFRTPAPPRGVKLIFLNHDIYHDPHQPDEATWLANHAALRFAPDQAEPDYVCVPCASMMDCRAMDVRKSAYLVPSGYFKLDANIRRLREAQAAPDSLLYAPTGIEYYGQPLPQVSLPEHGAAIVAALLEHFPDYRVIFRPHPITHHTPQVAEIRRRFAAEPRFVCDLDRSDYLESYSRAALMVSDMAGTAYTYAFSTLRPVAFFSHQEATVQREYGHSLFYRNRERIGLVATSLPDLVQAVRRLLAERAERGQAIRAFRDAEMYHVGQSEAEFVRTLFQIVRGEVDPGWRRVIPAVSGLTPNPVPGSPPELVEEGYRQFNLVRFRGRYLGLAQSLGPLELEPLLERQGGRLAELLAGGLCIPGDSPEEIRRRLDTRSAPAVPLLVEADYRGFNTIQYGERFVGLARRLGPVDLAGLSAEALEAYQQAGLAVVAHSPAEVRARVDRLEGRP